MYCMWSTFDYYLLIISQSLFDIVMCILSHGYIQLLWFNNKKIMSYFRCSIHNEMLSLQLIKVRCLKTLKKSSIFVILMSVVHVELYILHHSFLRIIPVAIYVVSIWFCKSPSTQYIQQLLSVTNQVLIRTIDTYVLRPSVENFTQEVISTIDIVEL